jgi:hypothetical protein
MAIYNIMAITVNHRSKNAKELQDLFTKYGCLIKVRLGLHEAGDVCSQDGLIILQLTGGKDEITAFLDELNTLEGIKAKNMEM